MEILAPAGNKEAFLAAVNNGADAIYMSGKSFGARAYAANFSLEEIADCVRYAHLRGIKIYLTVNTILADSEMAEAVEFVVQLYNVGVDAIIIQDFGLIQILRSTYPQIRLNASTQMTFHNSLGCEMAENLGFKRVILAREVSIAEMAAITKVVTIEIESFVHGALCFCYSGQCLFSSLVGGRSGNRGRCAQPCRLKYQLMSGSKSENRIENKIVAENCHLISPKDLKGYEHLKDLANAGVFSAKIEGRMKRAEYVATVVKAYSMANHDQVYDNQKDLAQAFNREFTTGYLVGDQGADLMSYQRPNNRGTKLGRIEAVSDNSITIKLDDDLNIGDGIEIWVTKGGRQGFFVKTQGVKGDKIEISVFGTPIITRNIRVGDRVFKTSDSKLNEAAKAAYTQYDTLALTMTLTAKVGQNPLLTASALGQTAATTCDFVVPVALKHPADYTSVLKQVGRLGGSGYFLQDLKVELDENIMLPASVLNQGRRDVIAKLEAKILEPFADRSALSFGGLPSLAGKQKQKAKLNTKIAVLVDDYANAKAAIEGGADYLYLNAVQWQGAKSLTDAELKKLVGQAKVYVVLPVICKENEQELWRQQIARYKDLGLAGLVIGNLWALKLAQEIGWTNHLVGDFGLNTFNSYAGEFWQALGLERLAVSEELNWQQLGALKGAWQKEALAFGNLKVMTSQHCILGAACGGKTAASPCNKPCLKDQNYFLQDEKGFKFPVKTDEFCRSHIFNGHKLCVIEDLAQFENSGIEVLRLDCSLQNPKQTAAIAGLFKQSIQKFANDFEVDLVAVKNEIQQIIDTPLTKGHYYRGVE